MIRLKKSKAFTYYGHAHYSVLYDHSAGRDNKYMVLLHTCEYPLVIGRELDLKVCSNVIAKHEDEFENSIYMGDLETALGVVKRLQGND